MKQLHKRNGKKQKKGGRTEESKLLCDQVPSLILIQSPWNKYQSNKTAYQPTLSKATQGTKSGNKIPSTHDPGTRVTRKSAQQIQIIRFIAKKSEQSTEYKPMHCAWNNQLRQVIGCVGVGGVNLPRYHGE